MKKIIQILIPCLLVFSISTAQTSWSEVDPNTQPEAGPVQDMPAFIPAAGVDFYMDATMQADGCPTSTAPVVEPFASTLTGPNNVCSGFYPWNDAGGASCFAAGDLQSGYTLSGDGDDAVLLTQGFIGVPSNVVGPNSFSDVTLTIDFTVPVNSFSFELSLPSGPADFVVEVFGASGSLGMVTVPAVGATPIYVGGIAAEEITSININDVVANTGQLIGNLSFDLCTEDDVEVVPTMGEWGIICLGIMMMIFGIVSVRQRQTKLV